MSFSAGVFSINTSGQPVVTGTTISSTVFNALTADLATGLSTCVLKDGTQTTTASVPFAAGATIKGVTTTGDATALYLGEYIESILAAGALPASNNQYGDATSISLTAGDWDVTAIMNWNFAGVTNTSRKLGISTTSGNSATGLVAGSNLVTETYGTADNNISTYIPSYRMSLASTTTVYMKELVAFSGGTPATLGARLSARRVR